MWFTVYFDKSSHAETELWSVWVPNFLTAKENQKTLCGLTGN